MISQTKKMYDWMGSFVATKYANPVLGFLFYLEAIFFVPTDPILILYCVKQRERSLWFATIATIGSVLGGITSYLLGYMLWQLIGEQIIHNKFVNLILTPSNFHYLSHQYQQNEQLAILIAGFTPIPFKAATLTAGFCKLAFAPFVVCATIARGARFFLLAILVKIFGKQIKKSIDQFSYFMLIAVIVLTVATIWFFT